MIFFSKLLPARLLHSNGVMAIAVLAFYGCGQEKITAGAPDQSGKTHTIVGKQLKPAAQHSNAWQEQETAYTLINLVE